MVYRVVKEGEGSYAVRHKFTNVCKGRRSTHAEAQSLATRLNKQQERTPEKLALTVAEVTP